MRYVFHKKISSYEMSTFKFCDFEFEGTLKLHFLIFIEDNPLRPGVH